MRYSAAVIRRLTDDIIAKGQNDKQWSTKHYTKKLSNAIQLSTGYEVRCTGMASSVCFTSDTLRYVTVYIS